MHWNFLFFMNSALLGVGLAMDAFSVSLANGMNEKKMKKSYISEKILVREGQISLDGGGQLCYNSTLRETVSRILLCREEGAPC